LRPDIIWRNTTFLSPDGHAIALIGGCSSFNNVSTAVLACVAIAMLTRTEWVRRDFATLLPGSAGDGTAVDLEGRLYVSTNAGVQVIDKTGKYLGVIPTPRGVISVSGLIYFFSTSISSLKVGFPVAVL